MDPKAESLAKADEECALQDVAKSALIGSSARIGRWRNSAVEIFGKESDIVKYYDTILKRLREQSDRIHHFDKKAMDEAFELSKELKSAYPKNNQEEITRDDHLKAFKPNGTRYFKNLGVPTSDNV